MKPQDQSPVPDNDRMREWMSALADGRPDAEGPGCEHWVQHAEARRTWHEYQLIGDLLRSDELASSASRDQAFLHALRERLAREPVILAPGPAAPVAAPLQHAAASWSSRRWAVAAAAAGFLAVGGVVVALQRADQPSPQLAASPAGATPVAQAVGRDGTLLPARQVVLPAAPVGSASAALGDPQWRVIDGNLIRDARLDAYLRAHRGIEAARPGAVSGRFETVVLER